MAKAHETDIGVNSWKNIRRRHWRNEAKNPGATSLWGECNVKRMKKGLAPQRWAIVTEKGRPEFIKPMTLSCELHHVFGIGDNAKPDDTLIMVWPHQHALTDPDRILDFEFVEWMDTDDCD